MRALPAARAAPGTVAAVQASGCRGPGRRGRRGPACPRAAAWAGRAAASHRGSDFDRQCLPRVMNRGGGHT